MFSQVGQGYWQELKALDGEVVRSVGVSLERAKLGLTVEHDKFWKLPPDDIEPSGQLAIWNRLKFASGLILAGLVKVITLPDIVPDPDKSRSDLYLPVRHYYYRFPGVLGPGRLAKHVRLENFGIDAPPELLKMRSLWQEDRNGLLDFDEIDYDLLPKVLQVGVEYEDKA